MSVMLMGVVLCLLSRSPSNETEKPFNLMLVGVMLRLAIAERSSQAPQDQRGGMSDEFVRDGRADDTDCREVCHRRGRQR